MSKLCVQTWKEKKTYDNKTGEHTGGRRPMFYTSKLHKLISVQGVPVCHRQEWIDETYRRIRADRREHPNQEKYVVGNTAMRVFICELTEVRKMS